MNCGPCGGNRKSGSGAVADGTGCGYPYVPAGAVCGYPYAGWVTGSSACGYP